VIGLRQFTETVGSTARIPVGDGTLMAAVKGFLGAEACLILVCVEQPAAATTAPATAPADSVLGPLASGGLLGILDGHVSQGTQAVLDLLFGLLGGPR
jgi:hypothetical protein